MPSLTLKRRQSKKQQAAKLAGKAASAAQTWLKARIAWAAGKKATKVAAPAVAVGTTAAVIARKRSGHHEQQQPPTTPAGVA